MEINKHHYLYTSQNTKIFKICKLYMQIWTAWTRTTWAVPDRFRSTICRRRSKSTKQMEINQNYNLYTSQNTKIFKICAFYTQIWTAWTRTTWPVPERFRNTISLRRSNTPKQIEISQNDNLYTSKHTNIFKICALYNQIWTAWVRTTWPVPERFRSTICLRRSKMAKQMEIKQNDNFYTSKNTKFFKIC